MNLETGFLERNMQGEAVVQLHQDLLYLGYSIPAAELQGKFFGEGTHGAVLSFQNEHTQQTTGIAVEKTIEALNKEVKTRREKPFLVKGRVQFANGKPAKKARVQAFHVELRGRISLGRKPATTNTSGFYSLEYDAREYAGPGKLGINLQVEVRIPKKKPETSLPRYGAKPVETVDLVIGGQKLLGPSEYEQLLEDITPLLKKLSLEELKDKDIEFLQGRTDHPKERIEFLIHAHKYRQQANLPAEVFYGLFRQRLPRDLHELLAITPELYQDALQSAIQDNVIPDIPVKDQDKFIARLQSLKIDEALKEGPRDRKMPLIAFIRPTLRNRNLERAFLQVYLNHTGPPEDVWTKLRRKPALREHVDALEENLRLHRITLGNLPLFQEVQRLLRGRRNRNIRSLRDLTRLDEKGWLAILRKPGIGVPREISGDTPASKRRNYARTVLANLEATYPRDFFLNHLTQESDLIGKEHVLTFFKRNPSFELRGELLVHYLKAHPNALSAIPRQQREGVEQQIRGMQRIYKLTGRYQNMMALLKDGLDSAYRINRLGQNTFLRRYEKSFGDLTQARQAYESAKDVHAKALILGSEFKDIMGVQPKVVVEEPVREEELYPDWSTLFDSVELCDCGHCQSVYGPAAYFVDMLHFLSDRDSNILDTSVADILFDRRPDLRDIELTCENTNLRLPYVDLVNEILENAVQPFKPFAPFTLTSAREIDLNAGIVTPELQRAFDPPLSSHAVITVGKQGRPWLIDEPGWMIDDLAFTYTIRKTNGQVRVVSRGRQTKGTPSELAANPQYVHSEVYESVLRKTEYPWALPFDLWWEEARVYLGHLSVPRVRIMETFFPGERRDTLGNAKLAHEYLEIIPDEARLITGLNRRQGFWWRYWGFPARILTTRNSLPDPADRTKRLTRGDWLSVLRGRVDIFLQQSGLSYQELLDLLNTYYINPQKPLRRAIQITSTDSSRPATCETNNLELNGFDVIAALKTMRFIRLWRKLGWSMRDVDRAISSRSTGLGANGQFTDPFLIELSHIQRLHKGLGIPVIHMLGWWGTPPSIDTTIYVDHSTSGQHKAPSLYEQLFRNRTVTNPHDPGFPEDPTQLTGSITDSTHVSTIISAFGISAAEYKLLIHDEKLIKQKPDPSDPSRTVPDAILTLDFLSTLHRHVTLAQALKLSVRDYLLALKLTNATPFASTTDTVLFVETINKIREAQFSLEELSYLLRHKVTTASDVAPDEEAIALTLDEIRRGLQTIAAENIFSDNPRALNGVTNDSNGELTRKKLALLNWDNTLIDDVVATLNGEVVYEAPLPSLPRNVTLRNEPREDWGTIRYDSGASRLLFTGPMTLRQRDHLTNLQGANRRFKDAIQQLFDKPRQFIDRYLRTFLVHSFQTNLQALPDGLKIPTELRETVYFNNSAKPKTFHFIGVMTESEREALLGFLFRVNQDFSTDLNAGRIPQSLRQAFLDHEIQLPRSPRIATLPRGSGWQVEVRSNGYRIVKDGQGLRIYLLVNPSDPQHAPYRAAVQDLFDQPRGIVPDGLDTFLTVSGSDNDADFMFNGPTTSQARFSRVLRKLLPYLRQTLSEQFVIQKMAEALTLEVRITEGLLRKWVASPADPHPDPLRKRRALTEFLAETLYRQPYGS